MKNIHKKRNLFGLIYALIMLLPMSSILVRCLYVTFNKNAYESYSGANGYSINYKYNTNEVESSIDLYPNSIYEYNLDFGNANTGDIMACKGLYNLENITDITLDINSNSFIYLYKSNSTTLSIYKTGPYTSIATISNVPSTLTFNVVYYTLTAQDVYTNYSISNFNIFESVDISNNGTLDNAFEYSLQTFVNDRGRGVLNLTDWFTSVFLEQNSHNQLYLDFVNWYMNYTLLISCVYLLYLVLMWFISLARRILTKYEEI